MPEEKSKVFLVEDDLILRRLYEWAFRLMKHEIDVAYDGEEAIKKLDAMETLPSTILLDIVMPKVNGFEVLAHIKESERLKNIPVIVLTNSSGKEEAEKALKLGAIMYLVKSEHEPKEIVKKVEAVVAKYGGSQPSAPAS